MTIKELADTLVQLGTLAGALTAIGGLLWLVAVRPFRNYLNAAVVSNLVSIKDAVDAGTAATEAVRHELQAHINDPAAHTFRK